MNRKGNPWVALVALILLLVLVVCTCTGCNAATAEAPDTQPRFTCDTVGSDDWNIIARVITDTETGVQYLFVHCGNASGLTVLEPVKE